MRVSSIFFFIPILLLAGPKDKVKEIQKKLDNAEKEQSSLKQQAQSILRELQKVDYKITKSRDKIIRLKAEELKLETEINELAIATGKTQNQLFQRDTLIKEKLVMLYENKVITPEPDTFDINAGITLLLGSPSEEATSFYINEILKKDTETQSKLSNLIDTLCIKSDVARAKFQGLAETRARLELEYANILQQRKNKSNILESVKNQADEKTQLIEELKSARANLESLIAKSSSKESQRSQYQKFTDIIWPIQGTIVSKFGTVIDPRVGTQLMNKGIDIAAPYGTNIVASGNGKVTYEGVFLGYGKMILVDHDNGFFVHYMHIYQKVL